MVQVEPNQGEIERAGAQLVYIAAEKRKGVWKPGKFLLKHPISFPFLLDEDRCVTELYGVCHRFGHDAIHIAHPATFIVSPDGLVRYIYRGANQMDRAPLEQVLHALTLIGTGKPATTTAD